MTRVEQAQDETDAVERFNAHLVSALLDGQTITRIQAKLDGADGMTRLCRIELALSGLWPTGVARELVWLTQGANRDQLQMHAFSADGQMICAATYWLGRQ